MKTLRLLSLTVGLFIFTPSHATVIGLSEHVDLQASFIMDGEVFSNSYSGPVCQVDPRVTTRVYPIEEYVGPDSEDRFVGFTTDPTADGIVGEYYSSTHAEYYSYVRDQGVKSVFGFSAMASRYYDGSTPEGEYYYFNYILDTNIEFAFTFRVDGEGTTLNLGDYYWEPSFHIGEVTFSLRDHTSGETEYHDVSTEQPGENVYKRQFDLEDGHVYTFDLDITHYGRAWHPHEAVDLSFNDHLVMPEPEVSSLWMLGLAVLGMIHWRQKRNGSANP